MEGSSLYLPSDDLSALQNQAKIDRKHVLSHTFGSFRLSLVDFGKNEVFVSLADPPDCTDYSIASSLRIAVTCHRGDRAILGTLNTQSVVISRALYAR